MLLFNEKIDLKDYDNRKRIINARKSALEFKSINGNTDRTTKRGKNYANLGTNSVVKSHGFIGKATEQKLVIYGKSEKTSGVIPSSTVANLTMSFNSGTKLYCIVLGDYKDYEIGLSFGTGNSLYFNKEKIKQNITLGANTTSCTVYFNPKNDNIYYHEEIRIYIGTEDIEYEPYGNNYPTPTSYEEINSIGEEINLFDGAWVNGTYNSEADSNYTAIRLRSKISIPLKANVTYCVDTDLNLSIFEYSLGFFKVIPPARVTSSEDFIKETGWAGSAKHIEQSINMEGYLMLLVHKKNNANITAADLSNFHFQVYEKGKRYKISIEQNEKLLPKPYHQIETLICNGAQYIDTGINADSNLSIVLDLKFMENVEFNELKMGAWVPANNNTRYHLGGSPTNHGVYFGLGSTPVQTTAGTKSDLTLGNNFIYNIDAKNHQFLIDGVKIGDLSTDAFDTGLNLFLFGRNTNQGYIDYCKNIGINRCQMYYKNEFGMHYLVRDFIPCYKYEEEPFGIWKFNKIFGLYDLVTNQFFTGPGNITYDYIELKSNNKNGLKLKLKTPNLFHCGDCARKSAGAEFTMIDNVLKIKGTSYSELWPSFRVYPDGYAEEREWWPTKNYFSPERGYWTEKNKKYKLTFFYKYGATNGDILRVRLNSKSSNGYSEYDLDNSSRITSIIINNDNINYISFCINSPKVIDIEVKVVLEEIKNDTESTNIIYYPYEESKFDIYINEPLRKFNDEYYDYIDFNNGKIVRKIKKIVADGVNVKAGNIATNLTSVYRLDLWYLQDSLKQSRDKIWSDKFISKYGDWGDYVHIANYNVSSSGQENVVCIFINKSWLNSGTLEQANNWLQWYPTKIWYILEEAIEENIDVPKIDLNSGDTYLSIGGNVVPTSAIFKYKTNHKLSQDDERRWD